MTAATAATTASKSQSRMGRNPFAQAKASTPAPAVPLEKDAYHLVREEDSTLTNWLLGSRLEKLRSLALVEIPAQTVLLGLKVVFFARGVWESPGLGLLKRH